MRRALAALGLVSVLGVVKPATAEPTVVEQVVARVDGRPILLSELRGRAEPLLAQMKDAPAWKRVTALRRALRDLLERRIDEELLARQARLDRLAISEHEVDRALDAIARTNRMSKTALLAAAIDAGYSAEQYREEIRRQLLEQRLVLLEASRHGDDPPDADHLATWSARWRKRILKQSRRQVCIERRARF